MSIYKYMPTHIYNKKNEKISLLKNIFEDKELWFSNPLNFNDPFELRPYVSKVIGEEENILDDILENLISTPEQANKFHYASIDDILNNIGVLSLTEVNDNLVMWAHYADNHKGVVIEFDKEHMFFRNLQLPNYVGVLNYLKKVNYVSNNSRKSINSNEYFNEKTFLTKSKDWKYEKEYRMTLIVKTDDKYIDGISVEFPNNLIKNIYIGVNAEQETLEYFKNLKLLNEWKHINIFKMEIDEKLYAVVPYKIKVQSEKG